MNRVSQHFVNFSQVHYRRTVHDLSHSRTFTHNAGDLVPAMSLEVLPGDSWVVSMSSFQRMLTLLNPIFDNIFCDVFCFFVPARLVWSHFVNFMGENDSTYWTQPSTYSVPQITAPENGWIVGSIADYLRIPTGVGGLSVGALPFRAYVKIVNDWFRDQNLQTPCNLPLDDTTISGSNGTDYVTDCVKGGMPFVVNKLHDYFTSALPQPQKGQPVTLPVSGEAPLKIADDLYELNDGIQFDTSTGLSNGAYKTSLIKDSSGSYFSSVADSTPSSYEWLTKTNVVGDLSQVSAVNINDLRLAFAIQRILELDARGGTRYIEILKSHFGVDSSDARLQRSEYLGGKRFMLDINTVYQTSASGQDSVLGDAAGTSATLKKDIFLCNRSFDEHGYIFVLTSMRYLHSYSQGIPKMFSRKDRYDFYDPLLDNIGEQPILNKEIFAQGTDDDDEVFGFNEAWADYRFQPNSVCGYMRPNVSGSIATWNLSDNYSSLPSLGSSWIKEDKTNIDRVIAVSSQNTHQFLSDFYFDVKVSRVMSKHSIPKLQA